MEKFKKSTLYIIGDSFSVINRDDICDDQWHLLLPKLVDFDLVNDSYSGTSQDWAWRKIRDLQFEIQPKDQLIVVLTHPSRFWFFEDRPDLSNHNIVDFDKIVNDKEKVLAAKYFIQYIQRPELDIQATDHRIGWLSNLVLKNNWRKPIILYAFPQTIYEDLYPNLIFSKGNLFAINKLEEVGNIKDKNWDTRYNHMCLSNHKILAEKLSKTILNNEEINLIDGFKQKIYGQELLDNEALSKIELSIKQLDTFKNLTGPTESWITRFKS